MVYHFPAIKESTKDALSAPFYCGWLLPLGKNLFHADLGRLSRSTLLLSTGTNLTALEWPPPKRTMQAVVTLLSKNSYDRIYGVTPKP